MLIKNNQPNHRSVGGIYLNPGVNKVDTQRWEGLMDEGYLKPVNGLVEDGIIEIYKEDKITIALVKETYDIDTLNSWRDDAKGPLKGAIKDQIKIVQIPEVG